jgi:hypothetical protein
MTDHTTDVTDDTTYVEINKDNSCDRSYNSCGVDCTVDWAQCGPITGCHMVARIFPSMGTDFEAWGSFIADHMTMWHTN